MSFINFPKNILTAGNGTGSWGVGEGVGRGMQKNKMLLLPSRCSESKKKSNYVDEGQQNKAAYKNLKGVASPGSMHDTGCLGLVHWDDPEGWNGEGGGFRMGNTCIPVADSWQN